MKAPNVASISSGRAPAATGAAVLALVALAAGCGGKFDLPTERRDVRVVAGAGTYQLIKIRDGMTGVSDILLTPGGELYIVQKTSPVSGVVNAFPPALGNPLGDPFPGLLNPGSIAFGANHLFVLDQGDTATARITSTSIYDSDCGPVLGFNRPIVDLSRYWSLHEFQLTGAPVGSFTDTTFLWVNGVAADAAGRVYVSGVVMLCRVDPFDSRIRSLDSERRIRRYERGAAAGSVIGAWHRDDSWEVIEGTGLGSAGDARGMQWAFAQGAALYFADSKNDDVQKFADPTSSGSSFKIDGTDSLHLVDPVDVSVDSAGYVYVADLGNQQVLRFAPNGDFVQRVDVDPAVTLARPIAVASDNEQVYVGDPDNSRVIRYRRRK